MQHVCESEDREEVVVCELCESSVVSFNQHMKRNHPGCGRSANRQGYRSNGSYVDGWFGGECGSGNPYYLLCGICREKYLALKSKSKTAASERYRNKRQWIKKENETWLWAVRILRIWFRKLWIPSRIFWYLKWFSIFDKFIFRKKGRFDISSF